MSKTYEVVEIQADGWEKVIRVCKSKTTAERAATFQRNRLGLKGKNIDAVQIREFVERREYK